MFALVLVLAITMLILAIKKSKPVYEDLRPYIKKIIDFIKDWRTLVSFLIAWSIVNGWSYAFLIIGLVMDIEWMTYVGGSYLAFLWMPFVPEKVISIPLAIWLKKKLFKKKDKENNGNYTLKKYSTGNNQT